MNTPMNTPMKDSGIPWIGLIPEHWEVRNLSQMSRQHFLSNKEVHHQNLLSLSYGKIINKNINATEGLLPASFDGYQIVEEGNIILRLTDLQNDHKSLRVGLSTQEGIITSAYLTIEAFKDVYPSYLYLLLYSCDVQKVFYGMGNGLRQSLTWAELRKLGGVVPPLPEQEAIADFLDEKCREVDTMVDIQVQFIEQLKAYKQSLIAETVTHGLNPTAPRKDSHIDWIGLIPQHWEVCKMKFIGTYINGYAFKPTDWSNEGKPIIRIQDLTGSNNAPNYYSGTLDSRYLVHKGDMLISWAATLDAFVWNREEGWLNQHIFKAVPAESIQHRFFYWLIKTAMINMRNANKHGIMMEHVTTDVFDNFPIPLSPLPEQEAIADFLDRKCSEIDQIIALKQQKINALHEYKKSIIYEYVTGKRNING